MKIFLNKSMCSALTGSFGSGTGYFIQRRTPRYGETCFFGVRKSKGPVPRDGHFRFIFLCANMADEGLFIRDIAVSRTEFIDALWEAGYRSLADILTLNPRDLAIGDYLDAKDVLRIIKNHYRL